MFSSNNLIRLFTCRLRGKKPYVFYADGNTNTTTLKKEKTLPFTGL